MTSTDNNKFPDFLFVGTGKSGTTSIDRYLRHHPQIALPQNRKETLFWHIISNKNKAQEKYLPPVVTLNDYLSLFNYANNDQIIGEVTPSYLYFHKDVISNLKRLHPKWKKTKIIIVLREPVDRLCSQFRFVTNTLNFRDLSLESALKKESKRIERNALPDLFYYDTARYLKPVKAYIDNFESVKILLYDDLIKDPQQFMTNIHDFIGIDDYQYGKLLLEKENAGDPKMLVPKSLFYYYLLRAINPQSEFSKYIPTKIKKKISDYCFQNKLVTYNISQETKNNLRKSFSDELRTLNSIIEPDISHWY